MELNDKELYGLLLTANRYAKSRNNNIEPAYTFDQTINILNRWANQSEKTDIASKILFEISADTYFINKEINDKSYPAKIENKIRKAYVDYAQKLGNIIDPKVQNKDIQDQINKIEKEIGQEEQIIK